MKSSTFKYIAVVLVLFNFCLAQDYSKDENVDIGIPQGKIPNNNAIAVVIGNRTYQNADIPKVEYAHNDAEVIKKYLITTLGYKAGNILLEKDITKARFEALFGTGDDFRGVLSDYIKPELSDVFIYYSGHGAPDPNSKQGYFVPVDCNPAKIKLNGYPIQTFYQNLDKLKAKSLTVVLDACFSGGSGSGDMLISSASPIFIEVDNPVALRPNSIVFTSSQGNQISSWYDEKKHGLLTFFFLNALRGHADSDRNKQVTFDEIYKYIADKTGGVPYYARRLHGREQIPTLIGRGEDRILASLIKYPDIQKPPAEVELVGYLQVNVNVPEAKIYINKVYLGTAKSAKPLNLSNVPTGNFNILATAKGYQTASQNVDINTNQWSQVKLELIPISPAGPDLTSNKARDSKIKNDMVFVQGGSFEMGDTFGDGAPDEKPVHTVTVNDFYIGKFEVTNQQYCEFLNEKGNQTEGGKTWLNINESDCQIELKNGRLAPKAGYENHPVVYVTWYGARAYCWWAGSKDAHRSRVGICRPRRHEISWI